MLYKTDLKDMKELVRQVRSGEADEKDLLDMLRENLDDILDMAENSLDLETENERLKTKLQWLQTGQHKPGI